MFDNFSSTYKQDLRFDLEKGHQHFEINTFCIWASFFEDNYQLFEKYCLHTFLISTSADYVIGHVTTYVTPHITPVTFKHFHLC